jgi:two-component system phosphate regulon sensor histidine kinase PhoR
VKEPVHLGGLIGECVEIVRPQAEEEAIPIETDIDPSVSTVPGDRNRLKQVILNLLTNAIKYNQPGGMVRIQLRRDGDEVLASVSDSGKGIPPESLPHIFERFYRVPDQEGRVGGTGLGLAISKRITEAHQGTLTVESQATKGTTFTVTLPAGGVAYDTHPRG